MTTDSQAGTTEATGAQGTETAATTAADAVTTTATETPANAETTKVVDPAAAKTEATETKTEEAKPTGAPEAYAEFTVPDEGVLHPDVAASFKATAKDLNLTQDQAQKLVTTLQPQMAKAAADAREAAIASMTAGFETTLASDKEIGGTKAQVDANVAVAKATFDKFGTPELRAFLTESRLGNHPELVRWAYRVGKAMNDDGSFVSGKAPTHVPGDEGTASRMYGSTQ